MMASTLDLSLPSEKFGTHSTRVCIREKNSWAARALQATAFHCRDRRETLRSSPRNNRLRSGACGTRFRQYATRSGDKIANFERLHEEWDFVFFQEAANFSLGKTGKREQNMPRQLRAALVDPCVS